MVVSRRVVFGESSGPPILPWAPVPAPCGASRCAVRNNEIVTLVPPAGPRGERAHAWRPRSRTTGGRAAVRRVLARARAADIRGTARKFAAPRQVGLRRWRRRRIAPPPRDTVSAGGAARASAAVGAASPRSCRSGMRHERARAAAFPKVASLAMLQRPAARMACMARGRRGSRLRPPAEHGAARAAPLARRHRARRRVLLRRAAVHGRQEHAQILRRCSRRSTSASRPRRHPAVHMDEEGGWLRLHEGQEHVGMPGRAEGHVVAAAAAAAARSAAAATAVLATSGGRRRQLAVRARPGMRASRPTPAAEAPAAPKPKPKAAAGGAACEAWCAISKKCTNRANVEAARGRRGGVRRAPPPVEAPPAAEPRRRRPRRRRPRQRRTPRPRCGRAASRRGRRPPRRRSRAADAAFRRLTPEQRFGGALRRWGAANFPEAYESLSRANSPSPTRAPSTRCCHRGSLSTPECSTRRRSARAAGRSCARASARVRRRRCRRRRRRDAICEAHWREGPRRSRGGPAAAAAELRACGSPTTLRWPTRSRRRRRRTRSSSSSRCSSSAAAADASRAAAARRSGGDRGTRTWCTLLC